MNLTDENGLALVNYVQEGFGKVLLTQEDFARLEMHSPIAAYDLPEGSGSTTNDRTSNNYDGTISGASWSTGEFTYGLSFDGTNDKVSFSTHPSTSGSFSVAAWAKIDSQSGFHPVATNYTPEMVEEAYGWRFGVKNGKVCLQLYKSFYPENPYEAIGTTTLSTSKWYLIAATYDASTDAMKVYVNGTDDTSGSPTGDYDTGGNFGIGWDGADTVFTEYYDGLIDSVAVYNTKLSATQVEQLWDSGDKSGYHLTTKEYDPDAGLYYFWARWYDPTIGRFAQKDVCWDEINMYVYCKNNPIALFDINGDVAQGESECVKGCKRRECSTDPWDAIRRAAYCTAACSAASSGDASGTAICSACIEMAKRCLQCKSYCCSKWEIKKGVIDEYRCYGDRLIRYTRPYTTIRCVDWSDKPYNRPGDPWEEIEDIIGGPPPWLPLPEL